MILYSIRRGPHGYQLGKFDDDFNVAAVYDVDLKHCTCPAGPRPSCKHRKMLPRMLAKVDTNQFYCYETQTWHQPLGDEPPVAGEARLVEGESASEASVFEQQGLEAHRELAKFQRAAVEPPIDGADEIAKPSVASPSPSGIRRR